VILKSEYEADHQLYHSTPETQTDEAYNHPEGEFIWHWSDES